MRFNTRSNRSLPPRPSDRQSFGELTLGHDAPTGASAFLPDPLAPGGGFHFRYDGAENATLSDKPQLFAVNSFRSNGSPALRVHYVIEMLPQLDISLPKNTVSPQGDRYSP